MQVPRDLSGDDLVKLLGRFGYQITRQKGSHIRLTTPNNGEHHLTIPRHDPIKLGTLTGILDSVGSHAGISRQQLQTELFG
jgi:predicted RNA binding protein YcfA (HicA-like mRNA interferase family)